MEQPMSPKKDPAQHTDGLNGCDITAPAASETSRRLSQCQADALEAGILLSSYQNLYAKVIDGVGKKNYPVSIPFDWSCTGYLDKDPSFCLNMQSFFFLDASYTAWRTTGNTAYKQLIIDFIVDWLDHNPPHDFDQYTWYKDAVGRRVFRMSWYLFQWRQDFAPEAARRLADSLASQADLLTQESFYKPRHNHGIYQDLGLAMYALLLAEEPLRQQYLELAARRSRDYFEFCLTEDGCYREHSPVYHKDVAATLRQFSMIYSGIDPEYAQWLDCLYEKTGLFLAEVLMPDNSWPSIGDSGRAPSPLSELTYRSPEFLYASSDGQTGTAPPADMVFPQGGYAVMRSSWEDAPEAATWLLFMASTLSTTHKHGDDLSLILYHRGDLFVEGGKRDFRYAEEMTAYAYSGYAHNVLCVDDQAFPVTVNPSSGFQRVNNEALDTKITAYDLDAPIKTVTAVQTRFENVAQTRTVAYDRENSAVTITDDLDVKAESKCTLLYHLAPGVEVQEAENGWTLLRDGSPVARVTVSSSLAEPPGLSAVTGGDEGTGPYHTWIFDGNTEPQIGSLLKVDSQCPVGTVQITTAIKLILPEIPKESSKFEQHLQFLRALLSSLSNGYGRRWPAVPGDISPGKLAKARRIYKRQLNALKSGILPANYQDLYADIIYGNEKNDYLVPIPFDWSCAQYRNNDPSFCFAMHGFLFLDPAYEAYVNTGRAAYKQQIMTLMADWVNSHPTIDFSDTFAWHDDATARRMFRMSVYFFQWRQDFAPEDAQRIADSLSEQANLLSQDAFYKPKHNHGMYQDLGLAAYALLLAEEPLRQQYLELAAQRSRAYFEFCFTEDGVHSEHSPYYHRDVAMVLRLFGILFLKFDPEYAYWLNILYKKTGLFLAQIVMPDGSWPSIGDSRRTAGPLSGLVYRSSNIAYVATKGRRGTPPPADIVFPQGGYAVMRSSWKDAPEKATWLLFMASTHSTAHKHSDDLSFILYHRGDLFVEGGRRNYRYTEEMTAYVYSGYAHNVLCVDDQDFPVNVNPNSGWRRANDAAFDTKITAYNLDAPIKTVTAVQSRFETVFQTRTVSYDKENGVVTIADDLDVKAESKCTLLYHLAAGIEVWETADGWLLLRNGSPVAQVSISSTLAEKPVLSAVTGGSEGAAPYRTWIFEGATEPQIGSLLKIDSRCPVGQTKIISHIQLL